MSMTTDQQAIAIQVCDSKGPLKGKGGSVRQWKADVESRLAQVYADMDQLVAETRGIDGRRFGLQVYQVRAGRQLRWRFTDGRHATWARVEPALGDLAVGLAGWYRQVQEVAQVLNHREQVLRYEFKTVERLRAGGSPREAKPYRGDVGRGAGGGRPPKSALDHHAVSS